MFIEYTCLNSYYLKARANPALSICHNDNVSITSYNKDFWIFQSVSISFVVFCEKSHISIYPPIAIDPLTRL